MPPRLKGPLSGGLKSGASILSLALTSAAFGTPLTQVGFDDGSLAAWTIAGGVSLLSVDNLSLGGSQFSLDANGPYMARILPSGSGLFRDAAEISLGLPAGTFSGSPVPGLAQSTNFGILTRSFYLTPNNYSFGWSYAAQDYAPYDDGVIFTIAGAGVSQVKVLASNFTGDQDTLIVGTYGSTPWRLSNFTIAEAGDYQLGFAAYNWGDTGVDPILYVDQDVGGLQQDGNVVPPAPPPTPAIDTAKSFYTVGELADGSVLPSFDGGVLQVNSSALATNLFIGANGGTVDTASGNATISGI